MTSKKITIREMLEQVRALAGHENFIDCREEINSLLHEADRRDEALLPRNIQAREALAEYAHEAWSGWMKYLFSKCRIWPDVGTAIIPKCLVERWQRQMGTPYAELPESEKASDREEADKMLAILQRRPLAQQDSQEVVGDE